MFDKTVQGLRNDLSSSKRKTKGQDRSKSYHKITMSVTQKEKEDIQIAAEKEGKGVSAFIKDLLRGEGIISKTNKTT